jgi:seryl-tRNA synthetase
MILLLVAVFDPLAVILTLAAVSGLTAKRKNKITESSGSTPTIVYDDTEIKQQLNQYRQQIQDLENQKLELENKINTQDSLTKNQIEDIKQNITSVENQLSKKIQQVKNIAENPVVDSSINTNDLELLDIGTASFGTSWPSDPVKNDLFLKTDSNVLYRWNGRKWIEEDKGTVDENLSYDYDFIKWLTGEVKKGKTAFEELSGMQKNQVKAYILKHGRKQ